MKAVLTVTPNTCLPCILPPRCKHLPKSRRFHAAIPVALRPCTATPDQGFAAHAGWGRSSFGWSLPPRHHPILALRRDPPREAAPDRVVGLELLPGTGRGHVEQVQLLVPLLRRELRHPVPARRVQLAQAREVASEPYPRPLQPFGLVRRRQ